VDPSFVTNRLPSGSPIHSREHRKNPRFDLHFLALMRARGASWAVGETADVSAAGTFFVADRPLLVSTPIEYVLTFPPDLSKAPKPLRVWFFGNVLRCERVPDRSGSFGIAVRNVNHRYLNPELSASFDAIELKLSGTSSAATTIRRRKIRTYFYFPSR
jgi:PilZ domain